MVGYYKKSDNYYYYYRQYKKYKKLCSTLSKKRENYMTYINGCNVSVNNLGNMDRFDSGLKGQPIDLFNSKCINVKERLSNMKDAFDSVVDEIDSNISRAEQLRDSYYSKYKYEDENPEWVEIF